MGPARGATLCPLRSRFAPRRCSYNKTKTCPEPAGAPAPGAHGACPGRYVVPASCALRAEAVLLQQKPKTAREPVGAPAPGANGCLPAPYPVIGKPGPLHKPGVPDISSIQQQRLVHLRMQTLEVWAPVGLPLGHQHQRIGAGGGFI